jgi:hypothetical protein
MLTRFKFFIEIGDSDLKKYKHVNAGKGEKEKRLGQIFIDKVTKNALRWATQDIHNLIFLIQHGGTKIDRVVFHDYDHRARESEKTRNLKRERYKEIFFRLMVRKIKFTTGSQKMIEESRHHLTELETQLETTTNLLKDIVNIILNFL